jgi:NADPH2:quinone reductase
MRAWVLYEAGAPDRLTLTELPTPEPTPGQVLIRVAAFGINRSELFTRQGHSPGVEFPRVLGIECVGTVVGAPGTDLLPGQRVAALMGGMGRVFDGGYAEYTCVPRSCVVPVDCDLPWTTLGAVPEMLQTAAGSLRVGLGCQPGESLLIRGGTSSIGRMAAALAREQGLSVWATTRSEAKADVLRADGSQVLLDGGSIAEQARRIKPDGFDRVLELIGTQTLLDSLRCARVGGVVCMTGILGGSWVLDRFEPMGDIPHGVRLTMYSGGSEDLNAADLDGYCAAVAAWRASVPLDRVFPFAELVQAHEYMEGNRARGKIVISVP